MTVAPRTRILIADDSAVMRSLLRSVIATDAGLEVAGTAADGGAALAAFENLRPDLILLDMTMPVMDGLATLKALRAQGSTVPVIMCSSLTHRGARVTLEALAAGASDYVAKPVGQSGREEAIQALAQDLIPRIHALTSQCQTMHQTFFSVPANGNLSSVFDPAQRAQTASAVPAVVAIGVSTGGPAALDALLPALPADFQLPVLIVQHMPELFTSLFAERLNGICPLRVRQGVEGDRVQAGNIYIARGNWHMEVLAASRPGAPPTLHLSQGPPENYCRPAVDVLFRSVAAVYGSGALGAVLTGMGSDGTLGSRSIRARGGSVLVQDQATSAVWGMPGAVVHAGLAQRVLPLNAIAPEILRMAARTKLETQELRESAVLR
jgi:two-component system chemotaxis response regulator CheB